MEAAATPAAAPAAAAEEAVPPHADDHWAPTPADLGAASLAALPLKVVAICGSNRAASCNRGLLRYAESCAAAEASPRLEVTFLDVSSWPLFNVELEGDVP